MIPEDFGGMGRALFGKGWQTRLSEKLGVDGSTIRRWVGSGMAVPPTASAFLSMMAERQSVRGALACSRQRIGENVPFIADDDVREFPKLLKLRWFPFEDMERSKHMPSIHAESIGEHVSIALGSRDDVWERRERTRGGEQRVYNRTGSPRVLLPR